MIKLSSDEVHDLKNMLSVSMGMLEICMKLIEKDGPNVGIEKLREKMVKSYESQRKIEDLIKGKPKIEDTNL